MQRMTDALSRMLNDPSTRRAMRTLGDREVAATRNQQRSQSEQQVEEGEEDALSDNEQEEVRTEMNHDVEDSGDDTGNAQTNNNENDTDLERGESEAINNVPDITIQGCSQNMDTGTKEENTSSHINSNIKEHTETDVKTGSDKSAINDKESLHDQSLETCVGIDKSIVDVNQSGEVSQSHERRSSKDETNETVGPALRADSISITDRHHQISNTTASLVKEAANTAERTDHREELTDDIDREDDTETDSVMRRNIDSLHQSISNMRDEFLER